MVDIEQGALSAFEQDIVIGLAVRVQDLDGIAHHRLDLFAQGKTLFQRAGEIDGLDAVVILEHEVVILEHFLKSRSKVCLVEELANADAATGHLVFVSRADAATGSANLVAAKTLLAGLIQCRVGWQNQRAGCADLELRAHHDATLLKPGDLCNQRLHAQHDAIADDAGDVVAKNPGRQQVQYRLLALDDQCVPRVVASLEACDNGSLLCEQIHDLALAFVSPLRTQYNDTSSHL